MGLDFLVISHVQQPIHQTLYMEFVNKILPSMVKLHWNKSVTAIVCLENLVKNVLEENKLWNRTFKSAFDSKSWYQKVKLHTYKSLVINYPLNLPPSLQISFLKLLIIFCCQSSWQEFSILKKQFLITTGFSKSNWKIKIRIFLSFILIFNLRKLNKKQINTSLVN